MPPATGCGRSVYGANGDWDVWPGFGSTCRSGSLASAFSLPRRHDRRMGVLRPQSQNLCRGIRTGINAYVTDVRKGAITSVEFKIAGTMPDLCSWGRGPVRSRIDMNVASEVFSAGQCRRPRGRPAPGQAHALTQKIPTASSGSVPKGVLTATILPRGRLRSGPGQKAAFVHDPDTFLAQADQQRDTIGSNNWVVAPSHRTGRRLANDPHREHSVRRCAISSGSTPPDCR